MKRRKIYLVGLLIVLLVSPIVYLLTPLVMGPSIFSGNCIYSQYINGGDVRCGLSMLGAMLIGLSIAMIFVLWKTKHWWVMILPLYVLFGFFNALIKGISKYITN